MLVWHGQPSGMRFVRITYGWSVSTWLCWPLSFLCAGEVLYVGLVLLGDFSMTAVLWLLYVTRLCHFRHSYSRLLIFSCCWIYVCFDPICQGLAELCSLVNWPLSYTATPFTGFICLRIIMWPFSCHTEGVSVHKVFSYLILFGVGVVRIGPPGLHIFPTLW